MLFYLLEKEGFDMKNMNRVELKKFVRKYFKEYGNDTKRVSYIIYKDRTEYLINNHYLYII